MYGPLIASLAEPARSAAMQAAGLDGRAFTDLRHLSAQQAAALVQTVDDDTLLAGLGALMLSPHAELAQNAIVRLESHPRLRTLHAALDGTDPELVRVALLDTIADGVPVDALAALGSTYHPVLLGVLAGMSVRGEIALRPRQLATRARTRPTSMYCCSTITTWPAGMALPAEVVVTAASGCVRALGLVADRKDHPVFSDAQIKRLRRHSYNLVPLFRLGLLSVAELRRRVAIRRELADVVVEALWSARTVDDIEALLVDVEQADLSRVWLAEIADRNPSWRTTFALVATAPDRVRLGFLKTLPGVYSMDIDLLGGEVVSPLQEAMRFDGLVRRGDFDAVRARGGSDAWSEWEFVYDVVNARRVDLYRDIHMWWLMSAMSPHRADLSVEDTASVLAEILTPEFGANVERWETFFAMANEWEGTLEELIRAVHAL